MTLEVHVVICVGSHDGMSYAQTDSNGVGTRWDTHYGTEGTSPLRIFDFKVDYLLDLSYFMAHKTATKKTTNKGYLRSHSFYTQGWAAKGVLRCQN